MTRKYFDQRDLEQQKVLGEKIILEILKPSNNSLTKIIKLLSHDVNPNEAYIYGNNAVHHASNLGRKRVLEVLIKFGADPLMTNHHGMTALMIASRGTMRKHSLCVEYLLKVNSCNVNVIDQGGRTSLRQAILAANARSVELLLSYGSTMSWDEHRILCPNDQSQPMALTMARWLHSNVGMVRKSLWNPYDKILSLLNSKLEEDDESHPSEKSD